MANDPDVVEERRRKALEIARQQSEAMEAGYRHLMGHEEPPTHDGDKEDDESAADEKRTTLP